MISIPIVSLFCGAGGLDCGFRREGFRTILACDNSPTAIRTFNFNAKRKVGIETDLLSLRPTQVIALLNQNAPGIAPRGVIGGPPCQGFSRGNVHADPHDARNRLPLRYAAVLKKLNEKRSIGAHRSPYLYTFDKERYDDALKDGLVLS